MPVNPGLAAWSDHLMTLTVIVYSLAMLAYAAELAYGRTSARSTKPAAGVRVPATVGASDGGDAAAPVRPPNGNGSWASGFQLGRVAVVLTVLGWALHLGQIATRGMAAGRLPWGNMYEFTSALTFAAVTAYLVLLARHRVRYLGLFVLFPVVLGLGLAVTVLYTTVGPLVPALNSYWIAIHVTAAIIATGGFTVASAATVLYLIAERYELRRSAGKPVGFAGIAHKLPDREVLDRLAYRVIIFAFPLYTFGLIAGAIWAGQAWGRYWGWDPKETWMFITWVVYAGYLHARATVGWKGRKAAIIALIAFGCLLFNFFGVNMWISGLHSYAGLG